MSAKYRVRSRAWADIESIYIYLGLHSPQAASLFIDRCIHTFAWLASVPRVGRVWNSPVPRLKGIRVWSVSGFPNHLIFYRPGSNGILILRVLSGARDLPRHVNIP